MSLPVIAIVGRPNVGKSTLLNAAAGRRVSVVDPTEGVTRDRVSVPVEIDGRPVLVTDTGGIGIVDRQDLDEDVEMQIRAALDEADVIIFVVDAKAGVTPLDREVARRLRLLGKPLILAANKAESEKDRHGLGEFVALGHGDAHPISAKNRVNTLGLFSAAADLLPEPTEDEAVPEAAIKVAIVGRRNAGKSTLVNAIGGSDRVIVSEKAGTTRDAIDVWIERGGEKWVLVDTAGFARKSHDGRDPIQWYSEHRALRAIRYCDVVILLLDVMRSVGGLEKRLADAIRQAHKPCFMVANKWDLVDDVPTGKFDEYFRGVLPGLQRAPLAFVSALEHANVGNMLDVCKELYDQAGFELSTSDLNRFLSAALEYRSPRIKSSKRPKIYYATQVGTHPIHMALFVNEPSLFTPDYRRFLENRFRDTFPVQEVPVRFDFRRRERKALPDLKYKRGRAAERAAERAENADEPDA